MTNSIDTKMLGIHLSATGKINEIAGNGANAGWEALEAQVDLIEHELKELKDAIAARRIHEMRGEIADVLFTTFGLAHRAGVPVDLDYIVVCQSQYSKFDTCLEDAEATKAKYLKQGIATYFETWSEPLYTGPNNPIYYVTKSASDQVDAHAKPFPKGKWLKSVNFQPVAFLPMTDDATKVLLKDPRANVYHDHLDVCSECREKVMLSKCEIGRRFMKQQVALVKRPGFSFG